MRTLILTLSFVLSAFAISNTAVSKEREPKPDPIVVQPATRYSGSTPIDLSHGLLFNNGTYGVRNDDYEAWARTATVVAGLSERPYSFAQKASFVNVMNEQIAWGEAAIDNWNSTSNEFPDALAYSKAAVEKMSPALDKLKSSTHLANGAKDSDWSSSESGARRALIDFRAAYTQMHKNVQARSLK